MDNYQLTMNNYLFYKDSAIAWLGEVPKHWEEKRVKDVAILERGKFTHRPRNDPQMYDGIHPFIQTGDVARAVKYVTTYKQTLSDKGITVSKWFPKGTLVMAIAANIGDVAIVDFDTYFPDSIVAYKSRRNDTDYLFYLFAATKHELGKVKVTSTQDNLNLERLNSLIKFIPPISEQKAIAQYLDTKTAQIDRKIDLLTQKANSYGELKRSLINQTVTRGLNKSVPMKNSGVEWIGEVPENWLCGRLKDFINLNVAGRIPTHLKNTDLIEFIPMTNVDEKLGKIKKFDLVPLKEVSSGYTKFKNGDVIFAKITPCMENGNVALVNELRHNIGFGSTEFMVFSSSEKLMATPVQI
jgi:type I restriction enzyme, S subunit